MIDHTAPDLLDAVGYDWREEWCRVQCPECTTRNARVYHENKCRRPDTSHIEPTYTGPALGTPDLDGILLVAGVAWLRKRNDWRFKHDFAGFITKSMDDDDPLPWDDWLIWHCDTPGHALARAIREVQA